MLSKYTHSGIDWIDLQSPTKQEVATLIEEYNISPLLAEEFITETLRSKVDVYDNLIYLVLHFPKNRRHHDDSAEQEIDFVIGRNFLITIHYELINPLHEFFKKFEVTALLKNKELDEHAGFLFFHIIKELYKNTMVELETVNPELKEIERGIFDGKEKETVKIISDVNRKLLNFRQTLRFHAETLKSFESAGKKFFGPEFAFNLEAITGEYNKIKSALDNHKEIINDLRDTNDSLLSTKTGETMRLLTIITFLISPVTLLSSIFAMHADFTLIHTSYDFYFVLSTMLLSSVLIFLFFKHKKWL